MRNIRGFLKKRGHAKQLAYMIQQREEAVRQNLVRLEKKIPRTIQPLVHDPPKDWRHKLAMWDMVRAFVPKHLPPVMANDNGPFQKRKPWERGYLFGEWLAKKGFSHLGSGANSQVYGKAGQARVIKVGSAGDNWMSYVLWGRQMGYEGKFVPKVYSYKWYPNGFYVAVVERMERTTGAGSGKKDLDPILLDLFNKGRRGNEYALLAMDALVPGLDRFAVDLVKAANDNSWGWDDHGGNFMVRADGSWVATDPIHDRSSVPPKNRIRLAA